MSSTPEVYTFGSSLKGGEYSYSPFYHATLLYFFLLIFMLFYKSCMNHIVVTVDCVVIDCQILFKIYFVTILGSFVVDNYDSGKYVI